MHAFRSPEAKSSLQWIDNPNNYKEVNHKDGDRSNNHLENLEWITHSDNLKQRPKYTRRKYEFIDELPPSAEPLTEYKNIKYDRYYFDFDAEKLIIKTKNGRYRFVNFSDNRGKLQASLTDVDNKLHSVFWTKFLKVMRLRKETEKNTQKSDSEKSE